MDRFDRAAARRIVTTAGAASLRRAVRVGVTAAFAVFVLVGAAPSVTVDPTVMAATSARLDGLSDRFEGTPTQRRAGELVEYHIYQDPIVSCMAGKGFSYTPPPFVDPYAGLTDSDRFDAASETWFGPLDRPGFGVASDAVNPDPSIVKCRPTPASLTSTEPARDVTARHWTAAFPPAR